MHAAPVTSKKTKAVSGIASTTVDASIEQCASDELAFSRTRLKKHYADGGKEFDFKKLTSNSFIYRKARDLGVKGLHVREWITKVTWKRVDKDTIIIAYEDCEGNASLGITTNK